MSDRKGYNPRYKPQNKQQESSKEVQEKNVDQIEEIIKPNFEDVYEGIMIDIDQINTKQELFEPPNEEKKEEPVKEIHFDEEETIVTQKNVEEFVEKIFQQATKIEKKEASHPIYKVSRENKQSKVILNHVDKGEEKMNIDSKLITIQEMISNIDKEILRTEIEIEVHEILGEGFFPSDENYRINISRLQSFRNTIEYLKSKRNILSKMLKG